MENIIKQHAWLEIENNSMLTEGVEENENMRNKLRIYDAHHSIYFCQK